jgi:hypothetical protein
LLIASAGFGADEAGTPRIYRCSLNGQIIFGDRPCSQVPSTEVQLSSFNSYHAPGGTISGARKPASAAREPAGKRSESIAADQQKKKQHCQKLADQLDDLRSKMRSGYSGDQGEKMRNRQRQLERQRRTDRCG